MKKKPVRSYEVSADLITGGKWDSVEILKCGRRSAFILYLRYVSREKRTVEF